MASLKVPTGPPATLNFDPEKLTDAQREFWTNSDAFHERLKKSEQSLPPTIYKGLQTTCWALQAHFNDTRNLTKDPVHVVLLELDALLADLVNPLLTRYAAYLRVNRLLETANVRKDFFKQFFGRFSLILPEDGGKDLLTYSPSKSNRQQGVGFGGGDAPVTPVATRTAVNEQTPSTTEAQSNFRAKQRDFHSRLVANKESLPPQVYHFLYSTEASLIASFEEEQNLTKNPVHNVLAQLDYLLDDMLNPFVSQYDALRRINQLSTTKGIRHDTMNKYLGQFQLIAGADAVNLLADQMQSIKLIAPPTEPNPNRANLLQKNGDEKD